MKIPTQLPTEEEILALGTPESNSNADLLVAMFVMDWMPYQVRDYVYLLPPSKAAQKFLGYSESAKLIDYEGDVDLLYLPKIQDDIGQAIHVVERLGLCLIPQSNESGGFDWYACDIERVVYGEMVAVFEKEGTGVSAPTAPLAICKAALLSKLHHGG